MNHEIYNSFREPLLSDAPMPARPQAEGVVQKIINGSWGRALLNDGSTARFPLLANQDIAVGARVTLRYDRGRWILAGVGRNAVPAPASTTAQKTGPETVRVQELVAVSVQTDALQVRGDVHTRTGQIYATGIQAPDLRQTSLRALKTDIRHVPSSVSERLYGLRARRYRLRQPQAAQERIGLIYEEAQAVLPEICDAATGSLSLPGLLALAIQEIQSLRSEIDELRQERHESP